MRICLGMEAGSSGTLFFTYRSVDADFVRSIAELLMGHGYSVWLDEYKIPPDKQHYDIPPDKREAFEALIYAGIDAAVWGIVFASDPYVESKWCRGELERLCRLGLDRLLILEREPSADFENAYAHLMCRVRVAPTMNDVMGALAACGCVRSRLEPVETSDSHRWRLDAIGGYFDSGAWRTDVDYVWPARGKISDPQGDPLQGTDVLVATIEGHPIRLFVDCSRLLPEDVGCAAIRRRTSLSADGLLQWQNDEPNDRERLWEEVKRFPREVQEVRRHMQERLPGFGNSPPTQDASYEPIGVHVFGMQESEQAVANRYTHRLFSYRDSGHLYRVYKLCVPQPQLKGEPVVVRFIFEFENDLPAFFRTLARCDSVVRSFRWVTLEPRPRLTVEELRSVRQRMARR